jgi:hypothetical protein
MNLLFLVGVVLGIPLTAVSLWRSRAVPRTAAALLVVFLALDLVGESTYAVLSVVAHVIAVIPAAWIALTVLRLPPLRPSSSSPARCGRLHGDRAAPQRRWATNAVTSAASRAGSSHTTR